MRKFKGRYEPFMSEQNDRVMNNKWLIPMEQPKYVSRHDKTKIHKCPPPNFVCD